ncbi:acyltransferase family protein [Pedobacter sp.]|uniref:acyltransferase family protein n=1 Tax=Pedobacter sp. TaxID=1411316 RepID=UPI003BAA3E26
MRQQADQQLTTIKKNKKYMTKTVLTNERNLPLDVLRGLTVALMITVNNPGSWSAIYAPLAHSEWHGFTLTDLVFPTFLFVVGNAISFTLPKAAKDGPLVFFKKIVKRTFLIFAIGFLLNYFPFYQIENGSFALTNIFEVRLWGVLQRIAVCYFFANLILYYANVFWSIVTGIVLLLAYWGISYYFGDPASPYSLEGNASGKLDLILFNAKNLYQGFGIPFEPEGLLSTLPAIVNVLAGYLTGYYIKKMGSGLDTTLRIFLLAMGLLIVSNLWDIDFPINKPIWSSSYVLLTVGWDLVVLAILILIIDVWRFKKWSYFFVVFGKNPLFIYIMSWIISDVLSLIPIGEKSLRSTLYQTGYLSWMGEKNASFAFAISFMLLMWLIGLVMDRKKIYVRV